jgi:hypothetical protein
MSNTCDAHEHTVCCLKDVETDMTAIKKFLGIDQGTIEAPPDSLVGQFLSLKYSIRNAMMVACVICTTLVGASYYINRTPKEEVLRLTQSVERMTESIKATTK